jgi:hypothetical protein
LSGTPLLYVKNLNQRTDIITITPVDGPVDSIEFYVASALVSPQEYIAAYDENDVLIESIDMRPPAAQRSPTLI